jgi:AraC-like DNA-binding protein
VVSLQVEEAPINVLAAVRGRGFLEHALLPAEREQFEAYKNAIHPNFRDRNPIGELRFDRAIIDASLMALANKTADPEQFARLRMEQTVSKANSWFRTHLADGPSVRDIAAAAEVSVTTLRRMFKSVLNKKPLEAMTGFQMEIATRLLETTNLKYESVAAKAGFASPRAFARFFTAHVGCSPHRWRLKVRSIAQQGTGGGFDGGRITDSVMDRSEENSVGEENGEELVRRRAC